MTIYELADALKACVQEGKPVRICNKNDGSELNLQHINGAALERIGLTDGYILRPNEFVIIPQEWELVPDAPKERTGESMTEEEYRKEKPLHDNSIHAALKHLAIQEADFATARYGYYHSPHEGLAIIGEEVHETDVVQERLYGYRDWLKDIVFSSDFKNQRKAISGIKEYALYLAQEAIHVAATAMRFQEALEACKGEFAYIAKDENRG